MDASIEPRWCPSRGWIAGLGAALIATGIGIGAFRPSTPTQVAEKAPEPIICPQPGSRPNLDCSGRSRIGIASFYANWFGGRTMADGTPMRLGGDNAASRTLPLGTRAKVTNLETGKSALITIRDRGPYVDGRLVDLSPGTARKIGFTRDQGLAKVEVAPIAVPLPDGTILRGAAANAPLSANLRAAPRELSGR